MRMRAQLRDLMLAQFHGQRGDIKGSRAEERKEKNNRKLAVAKSILFEYALVHVISNNFLHTN